MPVYRSRVGASGYGRAVCGFKKFSRAITHLTLIAMPDTNQKNEHEQEEGSCQRSHQNDCSRGEESACTDLVQ